MFSWLVPVTSKELSLQTMPYKKRITWKWCVLDVGNSVSWCFLQEFWWRMMTNVRAELWMWKVSYPCIYTLRIFICCWSCVWSPISFASFPQKRHALTANYWPYTTRRTTNLLHHCHEFSLCQHLSIFFLKNNTSWVASHNPKFNAKLFCKWADTFLRNQEHVPTLWAEAQSQRHQGLKITTSPHIAKSTFHDSEASKESNWTQKLQWNLAIYNRIAPTTLSPAFGVHENLQLASSFSLVKSVWRIAPSAAGCLCFFQRPSVFPLLEFVWVSFVNCQSKKFFLAIKVAHQWL